MNLNTAECTNMIIESFRRTTNDKRPVEMILNWCGHADGNAEYLINDLMKTECRLYLVGVCILVQNDVDDLFDPYAFISSHTQCYMLNECGEEDEEKM